MFLYLLFLKRKLQIKVNEVIPLIVFPLFTPESLLIIHLFYFILLLLILNFFPPLSSLFLTFQEVDMTALQFAGPSFPLSSSHHPSSYFLPSNLSSPYTYPNPILRLT